jgi:chemosensory pili system protein ChpA (sensor histidine kinase/response regulator)
MTVLAEGPVGPAVLFVDDSLSVRRAAEAALVPLGVRVFTAVDGEDALVRLRQGGIDLVFTDLEMPRLNGYDLLREIRAVPAWKDLPVVVVTSRAGGKHRDLAAALGASGYVTKPFSAEALAAFLPRTTP